MTLGGATIPLRQGRNVWRLWRTDRDGASRGGVTETVGPAVAKMLRPAGPGEGPWEIFRTDGGNGNPTWRVGNARPIELTHLSRYARARAPSMGVPRKGGVVLAERHRYPGDTLPTVSGQTPWWVIVDVWWRAPDTTIPWPGFRVTWLGARIDTVIDADWVLERAVFVPPSVEKKTDPGDATSAEEHAEHTTEILQWATPPALIIAGVALYLYADAKGWI